MIDYINHLERQRIITIEDPVEYLFRDHLSLITQREVGIDTQSFHAALVHIMRQDPDIIVIGEMRDETSFKTALDAAETGHLVFSTMHSGNAAVAVQRILQFFPTNEWEQARLALAGNLHAIICQRLLRGAQGGLFPAVELLINTSTVRKLIEKDRLDVISAAIETGVDDGMLTFNQSIYKLIKNGQVTEQEGMLHATNPAALRMNLQGIFLDEGKRILAT
jgi:pilus retraction protein PilT